jgi:hypothetical protein
MNDEVKYPVIRPEGFSEEEWQELEDMWKRMEANTKACIEAHINSGKPLVRLEPLIEDCDDLTGEPDEEVSNNT